MPSSGGYWEPNTVSVGALEEMCICGGEGVAWPLFIPQTPLLPRLEPVPIELLTAKSKQGVLILCFEISSYHKPYIYILISIC